MCGIADALQHTEPDLYRVVSEKIGAIHHRGPDDWGVRCCLSIGRGLTWPPFGLAGLRCHQRLLSPPTHEQAISKENR